MNLIEFSAEDFRQFIYCPRIIFFRYVAKLHPRRTYKMKRGEQYHKEKVRRKIQTREKQLMIDYNVFLKEEKLGLYALFDAIAKEEHEYFPIEFKTGKIAQQIPLHHRVQLVVQAIILEEVYGQPVNKAEIRYEGSEKRTLSIGLKDKEQVLQQQTQMLKIVINESLPPPTSHTRKCQDCEFWIPCQRA